MIQEIFKRQVFNMNDWHHHDYEIQQIMMRMGIKFGNVKRQRGVTTIGSHTVW